MGMLRIVTVITALVLAVAGCSSAGRVSLNLGHASTAEVERGRFERGRELLDGIELVDSASSWAAGDSVLFGIAMDAPGVERTWYMRATVLGVPELHLDGQVLTRSDSVRVEMRTPQNSARAVRFNYGIIPVVVELFDQDLKPLSQNEAMMPDLCLRWGLVDFVELGRSGVDFWDEVDLSQPGELAATETQKRLFAGWLALMRLPDFLHRESMKGLVWQLVERPSLLSIITSRGISMSLLLVPTEASEAEPPIPGLSPAYRVPLHVKINGRAAMYCSLLLTRPAPPLGPSSGLLGFDAEHPRDPQRRVKVRLLAAQRRDITPPPPLNLRHPGATQPGAADE